MVGSTALLLTALVMPPPTPLLDAMRGQRWEDAQRRVEAGAEVNERDGLSNTPLMWAIIAGRKELVASLLAAGADPEAVDQVGLPCLMLAVRHHRPEIAELLCDAGANPEARGPEDRTALMDAAAMPGTSQTLLTTLLESGADVNGTDRRGFTPLLHAVTAGSVDTVRYLLANGAWPDWRAADGSHAMQLARDHLRRPIANVLCEHGVSDTDPVPVFQDPAFNFMAHALLRGEIHLLQGLRQAGYGPERQSSGRTLLHVAARWGGPDALGALFELQPRLSLEARDAFGWTPLMHAVCSGRVDAVSLLLRQGAKPAGASSGPSVLDVAIFQADSLMLRFLLRSGLVVDSQCLYRILANDDVALLAAVIDGMAPEEVSKRRFSITLATHVGAARCGLYLHRRFPTDADLPAAITAGMEELALTLIAEGAPVDPSGHYPLVAALRRPRLVRALLDAGADPNRVSSSTSPLGYAAGAAPVEVVKMLLDHGADPDVWDYRGQTPLVVAARAGDLPTVTALLEGGARINLRGQDGFSAWEGAVRGGHREVALLLERKGASTLSMMQAIHRRLIRDAALLLAGWSLLLALAAARGPVLRSAFVGAAVGGTAALAPTLVYGFAVRHDLAWLADASHARLHSLIDANLAIAFLGALACHSAGVVVLGRLAPSRVFGIVLVLASSLLPTWLVLRNLTPYMTAKEFAMLTGSPLSAAGACAVVIVVGTLRPEGNKRWILALVAGVVSLWPLGTAAALLRPLY